MRNNCPTRLDPPATIPQRKAPEGRPAALPPRSKVSSQLRNPGPDPCCRQSPSLPVPPCCHVRHLPGPAPPPPCPPPAPPCHVPSFPRGLQPFVAKRPSVSLLRPSEAFWVFLRILGSSLLPESEQHEQYGRRVGQAAQARKEDAERHRRLRQQPQQSRPRKSGAVRPSTHFLAHPPSPVLPLAISTMTM